MVVDVGTVQTVVLQDGAAAELPQRPDGGPLRRVAAQLPVRAEEAAAQQPPPAVAVVDDEPAVHGLRQQGVRGRPAAEEGRQAAGERSELRRVQPDLRHVTRGLDGGRDVVERVGAERQQSPERTVLRAELVGVVDGQRALPAVDHRDEVGGGGQQADLGAGAEAVGEGGAEQGPDLVVPVEDGQEGGDLGEIVQGLLVPAGGDRGRGQHQVLVDVQPGRPPGQRVQPGLGLLEAGQRGPAPGDRAPGDVGQALGDGVQGAHRLRRPFAQHGARVGQRVDQLLRDGGPGEQQLRLQRVGDVPDGGGPGHLQRAREFRDQDGRADGSQAGERQQHRQRAGQRRARQRRRVLVPADEPHLEVARPQGAVLVDHRRQGGPGALRPGAFADTGDQGGEEGPVDGDERPGRLAVEADGVQRGAVLGPVREAHGGEPGQRAGADHRPGEVLQDAPLGLAQPGRGRARARAVAAHRVQHLGRVEGE